MPDGQRDVVCNRVSYEERPELPRISTVDQTVTRIKRDNVRDLYSKCLAELKNIGFELQPRAADTVSGFFKEKRILRIYPKKNYFSFRINHGDGSWTDRIRIEKMSDWIDFVKQQLEPRLKEFNAEDSL